MQGIAEAGSIHLHGAQDAAVVFDGVDVVELWTHARNGRRDQFLVDVHVKGIQQQTKGGVPDRFHKAHAIIAGLINELS